MRYESHILPRAQRDIERLSSKKTQTSILKTCTDELEENPRPHGYLPVKGVKGNTDLYRVYSEDGKYRILYGVEDDLRAVIIVAVRRRREGTYKNIPIKSLSAKLSEIALELETRAPRIRELAVQMGIDWIPGLDDRQVRCLDIGIESIKDGRISTSLIAQRIKETIKVNETVEKITRDIQRFLEET
jgi:mRNA-degrading endonuclease RelE of RelBE toxin-antitoxin system